MTLATPGIAGLGTHKLGEAHERSRVSWYSEAQLQSQPVTPLGHCSVPTLKTGRVAVQPFVENVADCVGVFGSSQILQSKLGFQIIETSSQRSN